MNFMSQSPESPAKPETKPVARESLINNDNIKRSIRGVLKKDIKKKSIVSIPVYVSSSKVPTNKKPKSQPMKTA
jgi:hypothetical protein